ncbi:MAG: hypothetical protein JWM11_6956 [Planctomycetaceae bacterium]|nr:hypothetical protein [Planctomycetaceae bacterium]
MKSFHCIDVAKFLRHNRAGMMRRVEDLLCVMPFFSVVSGDIHPVLRLLLTRRSHGENRRALWIERPEPQQLLEILASRLKFSLISGLTPAANCLYSFQVQLYLKGVLP